MQQAFRLTRTAAASLVVFGAPFAAANAAGTYDGTWAGVPAIQGNSSGNCPAWNGFRLNVANNKFNQEIGRALLQGAIAPDGSFSTSGSYTLQHQGMQQVEFSGRAAGNQLNAVYHTKFCTYNMTLHRQ